MLADESLKIMSDYLFVYLRLANVHVNPLLWSMQWCNLVCKLFQIRRCFQSSDLGCTSVRAVVRCTRGRRTWGNTWEWDVAWSPARRTFLASTAHIGLGSKRASSNICCRCTTSSRELSRWLKVEHFTVNRRNWVKLRYLLPYFIMLMW